MRVLHAVLDLVDGLYDLVLGIRCAGCGRAGRVWCGGCAVALEGPVIETRPVPCPEGMPRVWAVTAYAGAVRRAITLHKDRGRIALAGPLGAALGRSLRAAVDGRVGDRAGVLVVPVPTTRSAIRERGHDPLARMIAKSGLGSRLCPALSVVRETADQSRLGAVARRANLAGAYRVRPEWRAVVVGAPVVLADDVVTTGATLAEAARALTIAGANVLGAGVVAATQRLRSGVRGMGEDPVFTVQGRMGVPHSPR